MNSFLVTFTFIGVIVLCFQETEATPCPGLNPPIGGGKYIITQRTFFRNQEFVKEVKVTYSCHNGLTLTGSDTRVCRNDGTWSGVEPVCVKNSFPARSEYQSCPSCVQNEPSQCLQLNPPIGGGKILTTTRTFYSNQKVVKEVKVTYSCFNGFTLTGSDTRVCRNDGTWSGVEPVCVENPKFQLCPEPETPENGRIDVQSNWVIYTCNPQFSLQGENIRQCINGVWTGSPPLCVQKEASLCPIINPIIGAKITITQQTDSSMLPRSQEVDANKRLGPFPEGTQLDITCDSKVYDLIGSSEIKCTNSIWSANPPICLPSPPGICPRPPPLFLNGTIQLKGDKGGDLVLPGATILYNCNPGFNLRGVGSRVCGHDGTWSAPLPECMPEIVKCPAVEPIRAAKVTVMLPGNSPSTFLKTEEQSAEKFLGPLEETTQLDYRCESKFYTLIGASRRTCMPNGRWSGSAPVCLQDCGRSSGPRTPFVTYGISSELGQWPWQVAIFYWNTSIDNWVHFCGASLVNERWVLTAAHCVQSEGSIFPANMIRLFFGKHFLNITQDDASVENREPLLFIVHPDYNDVTYDSDIALIKIRAVRFTSRIQPICLPDVTDIDLRLQKGNLGTVTGWGSQEDGNLSEVLKYVQVPVVPLQQCRDAYSKLNVSVSIDKNTICAGHEEGQKDACGGDSGGPLVFTINPHSKDKWVIEGIVSWGSPFACGNKEQYSGYTRVQSFVTWIKNLIEH